MSLRIYLLSIALTWATATGCCLFIKHEMYLLTLFALLTYCTVVLAIAFKIDALDSDPPLRLIGARDKPQRYQDYE